MFIQFRTVGLYAFALTFHGVAAGAQTPATSATPVSIVVASPTYASVTAEVTVDRPIADVWAFVGDFCDIRDWVPTTCEIVSGKENELGNVRTTGREIIVGETEYSYTYAQALVEGRPYNMYHGTLEARPITPKTTKLIYSLVADNSMLPDDAAREQNRKRRTALITRLLQNMKILAEGGTVPPYEAPRSPAQGRQ